MSSEHSGSIFQDHVAGSHDSCVIFLFSVSNERLKSKIDLILPVSILQVSGYVWRV